ncbi:MAG: hypothetical protein IVW57_08460 [Ktedonobacterales bacterium]|nr:hypothetical protein [Ktedonobacterales bacterium]
MADDLIALFELEEHAEGISIVAEKHYRLVASKDVSPADLETYRQRTSE